MLAMAAKSLAHFGKVIPFFNFPAPNLIDWWTNCHCLGEGGTLTNPCGSKYGRVYIFIKKLP